MASLRQLSLIYLIAAGSFAVSIFLAHNPDWAAAANNTARLVRVQGGAAAVSLTENVLKPGYAVARDEAEALIQMVTDTISPSPAPVSVPKIIPVKTLPAIRTYPRSGYAAAKPEHPVVVATHEPRATLQLAPQAEAPPPRATPPDVSPPSDAEIVRVQQRLADNLTGEMRANFDLFLYVSKADSGPWAQRMYVFQKNGDTLSPLYNWPVSTGREKIEYNPAGAKLTTFTPQGYYELDPKRFYARYHSMQWGKPMPHAMFFSWIKDGYQTGLAIHGASGDDVGLLGTRASAGCIHLAPENAALLFNLIRTQYRGLAPQFAYDRKTATMSNDGVLLHDRAGQLKLAQGYRVLVFIENYGGENVVAALF